MNPALGFTLFWHGTQDQHAQAKAAQKKALGHFSDLIQHTLMIGNSTLSIWGRGGLDDCIHTLPDGSVFVLIGSPVGHFSLQDIEKDILDLDAPEDFRLSWEGRVILLRIRADGNQWMFWNDWLGSIPVFYTQSSKMRIASTLEPTVVTANQFSADDIFLPGLLLLLSHGNFLADWTLFKKMRTIRADSVTSFDEEGIHTTRCQSVTATDNRWQQGWDELVEEMHSLVTNAIGSALGVRNAWIVPLSGGLDSRLIAAVGAEAGIDLHTYTWGPAFTRDGIASHQIAKALGLPWQRIDLGDTYLEQYLPHWVDLFGSAMHFHGMYQIPFLETLKGITNAPIVSGYIGESLAGYDTRFQAEFHFPGRRYYLVHPAYWLHWQIEELQDLLHIPVDGALEEIADMIEAEKSAVGGPWFQKIRFLTLWGRQNHFTYFQSMISDYYRGVATPYMDRAYANFCLSLPRALLDNRHLQIDMMRRFYPKVMDISGTYAHEPAILTGSYLLKRRLAKALPTALGNRVLPEFTAKRNSKSDIISLRACGKKSVWPPPETLPVLEEWINMDHLEEAYNDAVNGDMTSIRKVQSVQTFAYRLNQ